MTCRIDHSDPACIPFFLCATCNPRKNASPAPVAAAAAAAAAAPEAVVDATRDNVKRRRRLRAEVRELNDKLTKLRATGASRTMIDDAERRWQSACDELATVDA